jgi:hypothetical protein
MPKKYDAELMKYLPARDGRRISNHCRIQLPLVRRIPSEARTGWPLAAITAATW